jgi:hypothetical protein
MLINRLIIGYCNHLNKVKYSKTVAVSTGNELEEAQLTQTGRLKP